MDNKYIYTTDWFSYNIPIWERFFNDNNLFGKPYLKCLEIGCFEGRATTYLLDNVLTHPNSSIDVIDTFNGSFNESGMKDLDTNGLLDRFKYNIRNHANKVNILIGKSNNVLRSLDCVPIYDIIYIDGSHLAYNVLEDAVLCHPLLKQYGLLIFDDYLWIDNKQNKPPRLAIDAFINIYGDFYEILWSDYQIICKKLSIKDE